MSKRKKQNNKTVRRTNTVRRIPARPRLHDKKNNYSYSLDQMPVYAQYEQITRAKRKPIEPERSSAPVSKQINLGAFHRPFNINIQQKDMVCAKRQIRREVIHAMGYGGRKVKKPKYTYQSKIKC